MKTVLLVEDEKLFLASLVEGLKDYHQEFRILTATDGREAIKILEKQAVDLVVTDLLMPVLDGFELIAYIVGRFPELPIIVVTAFSPADTGQQIKGLIFSYLQKPLDFRTLIEKIRSGLQLNAAEENSEATLPGYLQLIEMEGKSCTLRVVSNKREGVLYIKAGEIFNADCGKLTGEAAVLEILSWNDVSLEIFKPYNITQRSINKPLTYFLPKKEKPPSSSKKIEVKDKVAVDATKPAAPKKAANDLDSYKLFAGAKSDEERVAVLNEIEQSLGSLLQLDGAMAAALVDAKTGSTLGAIGGGLNIEAAAIENSNFFKRKVELIKKLEMDDKIEDILTNSVKQYHLIRPLAKLSELFVYFVLNREDSNLALARRSLAEVERQISATV